MLFPAELTIHSYLLALWNTPYDSLPSVWLPWRHIVLEQEIKKIAVFFTHTQSKLFSLLVMS